MTDPYVPPPVIQGDPEIFVTRQKGLDPQRVVAPDPTPLPAIVQGDPEVTATRQPGNGAQFFDGNVLYSDRPIATITTFSDGPMMLIADAPISRDADAGYPGHRGVVPGNPALFAPKPTRKRGRKADAKGVFMSDQPAPGQQPEAKPQTFSADQLAAAQAAKKAERK